MQFHLTFPTFSFVRPAYFFKKTVLLFEAMAIWCLRRRKYRKTKREFWSAPRDWRRNWGCFRGSVTMNALSGLVQCGRKYFMKSCDVIQMCNLSSLRWFRRIKSKYLKTYYVLYIQPERDPKFRFITRFNLGMFRAAKSFVHMQFLWNLMKFCHVQSLIPFPTLSSHDENLLTKCAENFTWKMPLTNRSQST